DERLNSVCNRKLKLGITVMTCEETRELISQFVDDVLSLPVRVDLEQHLDRCPVCRAHVAEFRALSRSLRQLPRPAPPADLAPSINAALLIEAAARRQAPARNFTEQL